MLGFFKNRSARTGERQATVCSQCGFDLAGQHWNHCPRCHTRHPNGSGCGGCGNCKH